MQGGTQLVVDDQGTSLPAIEILTGRGFITGKSGSGKSNTANVIVEELLTAGHPLLIIDTDGEYWGLKDTFEILHIGSGDRCDVHVDDVEAGAVVDVALGGFPVIYDISEILSGEKATDLLADLVTELFRQQKREKEPLLLVVEEVHEYIPEQGSTGEVGDSLIQIAKRGRKHGLGFCGISQRPAAVDKDFITQCDWIIWHKLTWDNDTDVVRRILGSEEADAIEEFEPGEVFLLTDWDDTVKQTKFKKKRSYDAGATPGFQDPDPPPLIDVPDSVVSEFAIPPRTLREAREEEERETAETDDTSESADKLTDASPPAETQTIDPSDGDGGEGSAADAERESSTHLSEVAGDGSEVVGDGSDSTADRDTTADHDSAGSPGAGDQDGVSGDTPRRRPASERDRRSPASERDRRGPGDDSAGSGGTARRTRAEPRALSPHPVGNSGIDFVQELSIMLHYFLRRFVATVSAGLRRAPTTVGVAVRSAVAAVRSAVATVRSTRIAGRSAPSDDDRDAPGRSHAGDTSPRSVPGSIGPVDLRQVVPLLVIVVAVALGIVVVLSR